MKALYDPWKEVPLRSSLLFFAGVFFLFSIIGFINDILSMGREPAGLLACMVVLSGCFAMLYAAAGFRLRRRSWMAIIPIFGLQFLLVNAIAKAFPRSAAGPVHGSLSATVEQRLTIDALGIVTVMVLAYMSFLIFSITEGRRHFRAQAEIELAAEIHDGLVPPIHARIGDFEFFGRSQPSGKVGGDLIDVVEGERGWVAYIADVSGHGVGPGLVMGMVKSAARMQLSSEGHTADLLSRLNTVLYPLKKPNMFVTLAYLAGNGTGREYALAGHPPVLQYHAAGGEITELRCSNLPVGILEQNAFEVARLQDAPGDVFVLITDGLLEVENQAGQEFGLEGVKAVLAKHATEPLEMIWEAIVAAVLAHGKPADDQSLLLVRRAA